MTRAFIRIGDKTDHGGQVIEGAPTTDAGGIRIARVGDRVTCPKRGHGGTTVIVSGDPTCIIEGQPAARHGDKTACGATLLSSQVVSVIDEDGGADAASTSASNPGKYSSDSTGGKGSADAAGAIEHGNSITPAESPGRSQDAPTKGASFDQYFALTDDVTGKPLTDRRYRIKWDGGQIDGRTDGSGHTEKVGSDHPAQATLEVFGESA